MFRPAFRPATLARATTKGQTGKRFASTSATRSRSWKSSSLRWVAAGALVYCYNTSSVFAEEPQYAIHTPSETPHDPEIYQSVHSIAEQRRAQAQSSLQRSPASNRTSTTEESASSQEQVAVGEPGKLEEEAEQEGAFNEETGEINWDCPCLGGMAHGPCGDQFRAAFSCFVFSKEEPKGVDCIEHFKTMQNCFREHPDVYGSELEEEEVDAQLNAQQEAKSQDDVAASADQAISASTVPLPSEQKKVKATREEEEHSVPRSAQGTAADESFSAVPAAWHDGRQQSSNSAET